jgi:hypothetical protein
LPFAWRDWYAGKGDRWQQREVRQGPVEGLHVSDPFQAASASKEALIAFSVPLPFAGRKGKPAGLLCGAVRVRDIVAWLERVDLARGGRIDLYARRRDGTRMLVVDNGKVEVPPVGKEPKRFQLRDVEEALEGKDREVLPGHIDPQDGEPCLAGAARTTLVLEQAPGAAARRLDWVVIVQHERDKALAPLVQLEDKMWRSRVVWGGLTALLTSALWFWLFWMVRRQDSIARA